MTGWDPGLTPEQVEALTAATRLCDEFAETGSGSWCRVAGSLRAAFAAKPRTWVAWVSPVLIETSSRAVVFGPTRPGQYGDWTRVRITEEPE